MKKEYKCWVVKGIDKPSGYVHCDGLYYDLPEAFLLHRWAREARAYGRDNFPDKTFRILPATLTIEEE